MYFPSWIVLLQLVLLTCLAVNPDYDLLQSSASCNKELLLQTLRGKKAQIHSRNNYGVSSIIFAANNGHLDCVKILLDHGAYINDRSNNGKTPILWAALWGHFAVAEYLISKGADLSIVDKDGLTVVMSAAMSGSADLVRLLISKGANVTAMNVHNGTALSIALAKGHTEIATLLRPYFARGEENPYLVAAEQFLRFAKQSVYRLYVAFDAVTAGWETAWATKSSSPHGSTPPGVGGGESTSWPLRTHVPPNNRRRGTEL